MEITSGKPVCTAEWNLPQKKKGGREERKEGGGKEEGKDDWMILTGVVGLLYEMNPDTPRDDPRHPQETRALQAAAAECAWSPALEQTKMQALAWSSSFPCCSL